MAPKSMAILRILLWTSTLVMSASAIWPWRNHQSYDWNYKKPPQVIQIAAERHGDSLFSPEFYDTVYRNSQLLAGQHQHHNHLGHNQPARRPLDTKVIGKPKPNGKNSPTPSRRNHLPHGYPAPNADHWNDPLEAQESLMVIRPDFPGGTPPPLLPLIPPRPTPPGSPTSPAARPAAGGAGSMARPMNATKPSSAPITTPKPAGPPPTTPPLRFIDALEFVDENIILYSAIVATYIILRAKGVDVTFSAPVVGRRSVDDDQTDEYLPMILLLNGVKNRSGFSRDQCIRWVACKVPRKAAVLGKVLGEIYRVLALYGSPMISVKEGAIVGVMEELRVGAAEDRNSTMPCEHRFPCFALSQLFFG